MGALSDKLDLLQRLAVQHATNQYRLYLIELLVEHAEEDDATAEFMEWLETVL